MKLDISEKGKTFHYELEKEKEKLLRGKKIGDEIDGSLIDSKFKNFKFQITGLSNIAGFPGFAKVEGIGLKRVLLTKGKGMSGKRSKKKKKIKGLRLRKTVRGNTIAKDVAQINLKVLQGNLADVLGKQKKEEKAGEEVKKEEKA